MGGQASCAGCRDVVSLVHARPVIAGDGSVALWCRTCWPHRDAFAAAAAAELGDEPAPSRIAAPVERRRQRRPTVSAIELPESRRRVPVVALAGAVAAIAAVAVIGLARPAPSPAPVQVAAAVITPPATITPAAPVAPAVAPVVVAEHAAEDDKIIAGNEGVAEAAAVDPEAAQIDLAALVEDRPTLNDWVHPVTGTDELVPLRGTRKFGARREGAGRVLCGEGGHCGVDLSGPRGRPVVAVAWGTVVRVEHSTRGRDGRSGRYVRLEHPEGVFTSYMHLDAIEAAISVGDEVEAGAVLGTLGKTAIKHGEQHLHFGLEIQERGGMVYVDPTPFLAAAQVLPVPDAPLHLTPADEREQW